MRINKKGFELNQTVVHKYAVSFTISRAGVFLVKLDWPGAALESEKSGTFYVLNNKWIHMQSGNEIIKDSGWGAVLYPILEKINNTLVAFEEIR